MIVLFDGTRNAPLGRQLLTPEETPRTIRHPARLSEAEIRGLVLDALLAGPHNRKSIVGGSFGTGYRRARYRWGRTENERAKTTTSL